MNVKPNDLAMVVGAPPPWAGATCTVLEPVPPPEGVAHIPGQWWRVLFGRPMPCINGLRERVIMHDTHLRKIGGSDIETRSFDEIIKQVPKCLS